MTLKISLFLILCCINPFCLAQNLENNLVPNGGFEQCKDTTIAYSQLENLLEWFNVYLTPQIASKNQLFGTPDHFYDIDDEGLREARTSFRPHTGKGATGVITYLKRVYQYREYISAKLTSPLEVGTRYLFNISLSSGALTAFGNIGTNGFGAVLSDNRLTQLKHEPLNEKPFWKLENVFFQYGWRTFTVEFTPNSPYQFLTLGNFLRDESLKTQLYFYDIDPQSYIFIDEVSITKIEDSQSKVSIIEDNKNENTTQLEKKNNVNTTILDDRKVIEQHQISLKEKNIEIWIWDDEEKDGDIISLNFNQNWIVEKYTLKKSKKKIWIELEEGKENTLILFAHNMGKIPPNTAVLIVKSGGRREKVKLSSTLRECGAIKFLKD